MYQITVYIRFTSLNFKIIFDNSFTYLLNLGIKQLNKHKRLIYCQIFNNKFIQFCRYVLLHHKNLNFMRSLDNTRLCFKSLEALRSEEKTTFPIILV